MADFSLQLSEDQIQIQKWVHDFAEKVVRPAAHEWDEREEFPRPIVEEAAKIGLYSFDFCANASMSDPTGLTLPLTLEELFWGDAGIGLSIFGSGLAAAGIAANGTPEQVMEWVPQCFGDGNDIRIASYCVSEPDAGSDVSSLKTRAVYDEANDEWVLNGTKAWATNGGLADLHVVTATVDSTLGSRGLRATADTRTPRVRSPSSRPAGSRCGSPSGPSRSTAATATPASTPSSACTVTPRSTTYSRAPSRFNSW